MLLNKKSVRGLARDLGKRTGRGYYEALSALVARIVMRSVQRAHPRKTLKARDVPAKFSYGDEVKPMKRRRG